MRQKAGLSRYLLGDITSHHNLWGIAACIQWPTPEHFIDNRVVRRIINEIRTFKGDDGGK